MKVAELVRALPPEQYGDGALTMKAEVAGVVITDHATYQIACEFALGIKELRDKAEAHHRRLISAAHNTHKLACDALRSIDAPLAEAQRTIAARITVWDLEQQRIRNEEESRLMRESAALAEQEIQQSALDAIESGASEEEIDAIVAAPAIAPPVFVPTPPRVAGVSKPKDKWSAVVDDIRVLAAAVVDGKIPPIAIQPNSIFLNQMARSLKGLIGIPGVRAVNNPTTAIGGRR